MSDALAPGSVIGILGGGQLGRMLSIAAARLGLRTHIYEPGLNPPAGHVAETVTTAGYDDRMALETFAESVDVVTFEFENIPVEAAAFLAERVALRPGPRALEMSQDRLVEKDFLSGLGLTTAPYRAVDSAEALHAALLELGTPAILKTRRMGYDGKGQVRISDPAEADAAFDAMKGAPAILEGFVDFQREISVIAARALDGQVVCYEPGENVHRDGILHTTTLPARISTSLKQDAVLLAGRILNALDYVGVMGVELFVTPAGLVVNEIAPRVHNSGHWTIEACVIDQFAQHVRAVAGWPLGDGSRHSDAVMTNLIGEDAADWAALAAEPAAGLHLYGKAEIRAGRKMGHITRIAPKS